MEVAAQAHSLHRVAGLSFDGLIFTNFAPAHGEFYNNEHDYYNAKRALFDQCKSQAPLVINADDQKGSQLLQEYSQAIAFSIAKPSAHMYADLHSSTANGITGIIHETGTHVPFHCPALIGEFNAYNILAA